MNENEKQAIEEMDKDIGKAIMHNSVVDIINGGFIGVNSEGIARELFDDGYRRQSEGAWEWFTEQHGNPIDGMDEDFGYRCSNCKVWASEYGVDGDIYEEPPTTILHYCPNCGAHMKGGAE